MSDLRIRMYNVGFGDCFLLTVPRPGGHGESRILIDCGKHKLSTTSPKLADIVPRVLADLDDDQGPAVDLLIVTHRHEDHVAGFALPGWDEVRVGEVWMPWTEDPADEEARRICDKQSSSGKKTVAALSALGLAAAESEYLLGYAGNNLTNAKAMNLLHGGFPGSAPRRFLPEKNAVEGAPLQPLHVPGVEVFVLGPSRSAGVIRDMNPPDEEAYHLMMRAGAGPAAGAEGAFGPDWRLDRAAYCAAVQDPLKDFTPDTEKHLSEIFEEPALELLTSLEQAVNGTSLVLLFHIGSQWLLFPGDAQWGTWNDILTNPRWKPLLERVTFYKAGHHGSHNANPVSLVTRYFQPGVRAMVPVGAVKKWPLIPRPGLLDEFRQRKISFARSDGAEVTGTHFKVHRDAAGDVLYVDTELPV